MNREDKIQESQYSFPYHHIPETNGDDFSQYKYWSWGMRYMGGIQIAHDLCNRLFYSSLLDVGCGDGRLLKEVCKQRPEVVLKGIDTSEKAISFAKAFTPEIDYQVKDVTKDNIGKWDVVTLIEVLEHVPTEDIDLFVQALSRCVSLKGRLILTVPHTNKALSQKHYQHFNRDSLTKCLSKYFATLEFVYFDSRSFWLRAWLLLLGSEKIGFLVTSKTINRMLSRIYRQRYLYCSREKDCMRIACIASGLK